VQKEEKSFIYEEGQQRLADSQPKQKQRKTHEQVKKANRDLQTHILNKNEEKHISRWRSPTETCRLTT